MLFSSRAILTKKSFKKYVLPTLLLVPILFSAFHVPAFGSNSGVALKSEAGGVFEAPYVNSTLDLTNDILYPGNTNPGNGLNPAGIIYDPDNAEVYVADNLTGTVTAIRNHNVLDQIPVGNGPISLAIANQPQQLFDDLLVVNRQSGTVSVINVLSNSVTSTKPVADVDHGLFPYGVAYDSFNGCMYVTVDNVSSTTNSSYVYATQISNETSSENACGNITLPAGSQPHAILYDPGYNRLYVADYALNAVYVIDGETNSTDDTIPVGYNPFGIVLDQRLGEILVTNFDASYSDLPGSFQPTGISVIDPGTREIIQNVTGDRFAGIAVDTQNGYAYIADQASYRTLGSVDVFGYNSNSCIAVQNCIYWGQLASLPDGSIPFGVAYDSSNDEIYVTNVGSNTVTIINATGDISYLPVTVGISPDAVAYDPEYGNGAGAMIVGNSVTNTLSVISNNAVVATVHAGFQEPESIAFGGNSVYVLNRVDGNLTILDANDLHLVGNVTMCRFLNETSFTYEPELCEEAYNAAPDGMIFANGILYVSNLNQTEIQKVSSEGEIIGAIDQDVSNLAYNPQNGDIYDGYDGNVSVIGPAGNVLDKVTVAEPGSEVHIEDVAYDPYNKDVYVSVGGVYGYVSVINSSNIVFANVTDPFGTSPTLLEYGMFPSNGEGALVVNPDNGLVFVGPGGGGSYAISVINGTSLIGGVNLPIMYYGSGFEPISGIIYQMAFEPEQGLIYSPIANNDSVSIVNGTQNTINGSVIVGTNPRGVAYDPVSGDIYVTDFYSNEVDVINQRTNTLKATIPVGVNPYHIVYDSTDRKLYVSNYGSDTISVIDPSTNKVVDTVGKYYYINTDEKVIDSSSIDSPIGLAFNSESGEILVANYLSNPFFCGNKCTDVSVVDPSQNEVIRNITIPNFPEEVSGPTELDFNYHDGFLYLATTVSGGVYVINPLTGEVVGSFTDIHDPWGVKYGAGDTFVTGYYTDPTTFIEYPALFVLNQTDIIATIDVGNDPRDITFDQNGLPYVTNAEDNSVTIAYPPKGCESIQDCYQQLLTYDFSVGSSPEGIDYNPFNDNVYVANGLSGTVSVVSSSSVTLPPNNQTTETGGPCPVTTTTSRSTSSGSITTFTSTISACCPRSSTTTTRTGSLSLTSTSRSCSSTTSPSSNFTLSTVVSSTAQPTIAASATTIYTLTATRSNAQIVPIVISGNVSASQISNLQLSNSSGTLIVEFTITGQNGTSALITVTVPKSAVPNQSVPSVLIDGGSAQLQSYTQDSNNYYVTFATHFSTHQVQIQFKPRAAITSATTPSISWTEISLVVVVVIAVVGGLFLSVRRRKSQPIPMSNALT